MSLSTQVLELALYSFISEVSVSYGAGDVDIKVADLSHFYICLVRSCVSLSLYIDLYPFWKFCGFVQKVELNRYVFHLHLSH
ncbi:hypothetical protein XENTR_v10002417 [Xenopus tropicalis]|nr:hypothetical protein XENTR_v10002417 [Xenopus tropicalis]